MWEAEVKELLKQEMVNLFEMTKRESRPNKLKRREYGTTPNDRKSLNIFTRHFTIKSNIKGSLEARISPQAR